MTEDQQPVWVESGLPTVIGVYVRQLISNPHRGWFAYFNGKEFFNSSTYDPDEALRMGIEGYPMSFQDAKYLSDAWWDYQGLMAKLQAKSEPTIKFTPVVKVSADKWVTLNHGELASDAVGIHKMAERNKPAPEPEKVFVGGLTIDMADLVEFLKAKQPKPEPNTTPRGILTMWNESADHRLGAFQQTDNFAD